MMDEAAAREIERLKSELETERMRLAACGVVAMSDTPESAAINRNMLDEYKSASCDDVARRVDECIELRAQLAESERQRKALVEHLEALGVEGINAATGAGR